MLTMQNVFFDMYYVTIYYSVMHISEKVNKLYCNKNIL